MLSFPAVTEIMTENDHPRTLLNDGIEAVFPSRSSAGILSQDCYQEKTPFRDAVVPPEGTEAGNLFEIRKVSKAYGEIDAHSRCYTYSRPAVLGKIQHLHHRGDRLEEPWLRNILRERCLNAGLVLNLTAPDDNSWSAHSKINTFNTTTLSRG